MFCFTPAVEVKSLNSIKSSFFDPEKMPRKYKRKTNRGAGGRWSADSLEEAIAHVKDGTMTLSTAAQSFGIPRSTLGLKIKGWKGRKPSQTKGGGGRTTDLDSKAEQRLVKYLDVLNKSGFGLSKKQVQNVVHDFVEEQGLSTRFKNSVPGHDWFKGFCERHQLSLKKPEKLESSRARQSSDPFIIFDFYAKLEKIFSEEKLNADAIYNCDETGFCYDPSSTKILSRVGQATKRVTFGSGRESTTVLFCVAASGRKLPPLIVHKGKKKWDSMIGDKAYPGTSYQVSDNGWMTEAVFQSWFRKIFVPNVEKPCLLIYDGHLSHISIELVETAIQNNIIILKLPPHTSHLLQPLDVAVFRGVKSRWDSLLADWCRTHYGQHLSKSEFANLVGKVWSDVSPQNIINGFRKTGIFPINKDVIPKETFDAQKLKLWNEINNAPKGEEEPRSVYLNQHLDTTPEELPLPSQTKGQEHEDKNRPSFSGWKSSTDSQTEPKETPGKVFERILISTIKQTPSVKRVKKRIDISEVITQEDYLEKLKITKNKQPSKSLKNNKAPGSQKLTPVSQAPEEIITQNVKSKMKTSDVKKKKNVEYDTSSSEDIEISSGESNAWDESFEEEEMTMVRPTVENLKSGSFILVEFVGGKRNSTKYYYVCTVEHINETDLNDITVVALNCVDETKKVFVVNPDDISSISFEQIISILPTPAMLMKGDRFRYVFDKTITKVFEKH